ncbi:hypothetical protein [Shinella sp.]|uniref:hypothetical protein n=1 Tax=Shinella sp. TaxID=1870904 RepID=UPI0029B10EE2|nr:hypothetical protein [Shinella sp.]MDX3973272.1 hypothetical protein [Shinella sp.]
MTNLPATLSSLNAQISAVTERLAPARDEHVSEAIRSLLSAGLSLPGGMNLEKAPDVYAFALSKVSATGVKKATAKLVRGEYELKNRAFIPTPPEFADLARRETRELVDDVARLKAHRDALTTHPVVHDEASRAKVRQLLKNFRAAHEASKSKNADVTQPMTDDRAEYWRSIMSLKDADAVTEEQKQFRRRIERRVSDTEATASLNDRSAA